MGSITKQENQWLDKATAAVAGARNIVSSSGPLINTPVGRLSDHEWGMIITAVRLTELSPSPYDVAVARSISLPLQARSKDQMTNFLMVAWCLLNEAETVRDHDPGKILKRAEFDEKTGDPIPFVP